MYAVVTTGGKQYRVVKDDVITVERLNAEVGETVNFDVLLVADGDELAVGASAAAATVTAEVIEHTRGQKVVVFKFKKRKGYKRTRGHRQEQTRVRIANVSAAGTTKKRTAAAKETAEELVKPPATRAKRTPAASETKAATAKTATTKATATEAGAGKAEAPAKPKPVARAAKAAQPKAAGKPRAKASDTDAGAPEEKPRRSRAKKATTEESPE